MVVTVAASDVAAGAGTAVVVDAVSAVASSGRLSLGVAGRCSRVLLSSVF